MHVAETVCQLAEEAVGVRARDREDESADVLDLASVAGSDRVADDRVPAALAFPGQVPNLGAGSVRADGHGRSVTR